MSKLVDIVNLNADASCLSSRRWMEVLQGGKESELYHILKAYVDQGAKVNLGIVGSTAAEIKAYNPCSIDLINAHPDIFEVILRPFIHSLSILWSDETFMRNVRCGQAWLESCFDRVVPWYLPPEFALRNSQLYQLEQAGIQGTFLHPNRLKPELAAEIPSGPNSIRGLQGNRMPCITFSRTYDTYYLECLQQFDSELSFEDEWTFGWRDGESSLFLPNSAEREAYFAQRSSKDFERVFLSEALEHLTFENEFTSYPQNSLLPWLGNFRLYWYMNEVKHMERHFEDLDQQQRKLFLHLLNSDILSSIEKSNVEVELRPTASEAPQTFEIRRKERNLDAEELFMEIQRPRELNDFLAHVDAHFGRRLKARLEALDQLPPI